MEDIELLDIAGDELDIEAVRKGELTPVFFGSALTNFGVEPFLEHFLEMTTSPLPRNSSEGLIDPFDKNFSAFVFKIQANMNKAHRDRIAFMRICSGEFNKGEDVYHVQGGKKIKLAQPQQFMAENREIVEEAYAGDIIGVFDPGIFSIGDTLCSPSKKFQFEGIPTFSPEHFAKVRPVDTMKRKQFIKGVTQIAQEGAIQVFKEIHIGMEEIIVGVLTTETSSVTEAVSTLTSLCSILSTGEVIEDSVITSSSTTSKYLSNILFLKLLFLSISIYSFLSQTQYLVPYSTIII